MIVLSPCALGAILRGGVSVARREVKGLAELLIDAEMKMFEGLSTPVIFLQNLVTDLLLGLGFNEAFRIFAEHVRNRYQAEPGFITMNLPRLLDVLEDLGIENPIVCASINKIGFRMCGGIEAYEKAIATRTFQPAPWRPTTAERAAPGETRRVRRALTRSG